MSTRCLAVIFIISNIWIKDRRQAVKHIQNFAFHRLRYSESNDSVALFSVSLLLALVHIWFAVNFTITCALFCRCNDFLPTFDPNSEEIIIIFCLIILFHLKTFNWTFECLAVVTRWPKVWIEWRRHFCLNNTSLLNCWMQNK